MIAITEDEAPMIGDDVGALQQDGSQLIQVSDHFAVDPVISMGDMLIAILLTALIVIKFTEWMHQVMIRGK